MKELEDLTYNELVDEAARRIHSGLLESGGKGLKAEVHQWLSTAIQWGLHKESLKKKR